VPAPQHKSENAEFADKNGVFRALPTNFPQRLYEFTGNK
jgi:hypothetical protein